MEGRSDRKPASRIGTRHILADDAGAIAQTIAAVAAGELVVFPTDTLYGVGVHAFDEAAIRRLYTVKNRPFSKGIPVLLADVEDIDKVASSVPAAARKLISRYWPGPLTVIVPKHANLPPVISPNENIALRIPDCDVARDLIRAAGGALATSSANRSGNDPAQTAEEALAELDGSVSIVLDDGPTGEALPSTIVDCTGDTLRLLRQGAIDRNELLKVDAGIQWAIS